MVLTVVVGSSGSGKTTFLNDTTKSHKCTYIRQYHNVRPYVKVTKIPNFDPTKLPFWDIYVKEDKAADIMVGGTMAGEFTAGFSGGQRKLLLFELICQRAEGQEDLLLVLDEPFAGVTDDFVPFIVERLNELRKKHNVLLVTNDHVQTLIKMADNNVRVSAIDRTKVEVNGKNKVDREKAIMALSVGNEYIHEASSSDLKFFLEVEVKSNKALMGVLAFTVVSFSLFLATFWDSIDSSGPLVLVAAGIIAFFSVNPWLLALVDWRNYMLEEAEALLHSSKGMNKFLMTMLTLFMITVISLVEWGIINATIDGFESFKFWVAIFFDSASLTFPFIFFGVYTKLPSHAVEIFASFPFLLMIFFSTTFSPGSGVQGFKALRYLFPRFYFWCMIPGTLETMEGCPDNDTLNMLYMILTGLLGVVLFLIYQVIKNASRRSIKEQKSAKMNALKDDTEFVDLQIELYGEDILARTSTHGSKKSDSSVSDIQNV
jgi:ABC-type lipoprotein export system ATPase subunit